MDLNKKRIISISSLNVKGLRGNFLYSKYLSLVSSVSFFCELWTRPNEVNLIKDLANHSNKNFLYKSDIDHSYTKGRPFGGQCWLFDKKFKLIENRFINKHLSYIHLKIDNFEIVVLGVYMPFNNSKNLNESKNMFELTLTLINTVTHEFKSRNIPVLLTGDFNADLNRKNRFDIIFKKFINDHQYKNLDENNDQNSFTFKSSLINNSYNTSKIDHFIFCGPSIPSSFISPKFSILSDIANLSDHNAINFSFYITEATEKIQIKTPHKKYLNLEDPDIGNFFSNEVEKLFCTSFEDIIKSNFKIETVNQDQINKLYEKISRIYTVGSDETFKFQDTVHPNGNPNSNSKYESKQMKLLKKQLNKSYGKLKSKPNNKVFEKEYKDPQKELRSLQRREIYLEELKELGRLERVAKLKNKNAFWRFTKKLKKKRTVLKEVTASPSQLFEHYKSFFMDEQSDLTDKQQNLSNQVNDFFNVYTKPLNFPFFTIGQLDLALDDIENSPVKGFDSISYQLIKKSVSTTSKNIILYFFNSMLFSAKIPVNLNISIIKPILKDPDKKSDDLNNIRPISISTCFAQILEKLILIRSPGLKITHKNQFGFKQKTSCNHALFTLKETILHYTENKTGIKIASLDAEKAFDKVWMNGLFSS